MEARSRALGIGAALLSVVLLAGCGGAGSGGAPTTTAKAGGVPLVSTDNLPAAGPGEVHLFGINDLHGNLQPPTGSNGHVGSYVAGGAAYLSAHLARLKAKYPASAILSAGDNVSASPLVSALFHDEPTIEYLNSVGLAASSVGNHEFDHGVRELARLQQGGCALDGCSPGEPFTGAKFSYLAANVTDANGQLPPAMRPWTMIDVGGHKIGVVGVVTPTTANIVMPEGIRGYTFGDEVDAINKYVPQIEAAGAETVVALLHDGGAQQTHGGPVDYNGCADVGSAVNDLAKRTDPAVRVLITGHTHQAYNCTIDGKVVTQAASYGRLITDITLRFHDGKVDAKAVNRVVTHDITPDPGAAKLVDFFTAQAEPRGKRVIGSSTGPLPNEGSPAGDSPLGDVIADSMLAALAPQQAVAALMNPGGVRADLSGGNITYEQAYTVQPFGNQVVGVSLTGRQLLAVLEQQWDNPTRPSVLSVAGIEYAYDDAAPKGHKVIADSVRIGGQPLNPVAVYLVSTNNFLASGGDGFTAFTQGRQTATGPTDLDALASYLASHGPVQPPASRIQRR
ncbi:bifunctional metallophosphatase/5'-nucleotidase [Nocardia terpenica]|uniref:bifunctional metallophosphatase/5'-nucleotidase n=1 Tax=Nocardia terpenica TaxID=455432 RepID=UPI001894F0D0|nr:bifunctional metallophosphatase/5'-nucleotidase [Nocardia terpenica]MBF6064246.1 bifunctional metallophosphatase/5'-nucleotidase [Nocardia terpenica]MBF6106579.1 bifunctional metallophosphatase/5'-nucleotidase [Nocardia terpenica]MBF6113864.1 bifunctional metallophosphatase/5'-nucleotidase [Nocardia terpenica]MBF6120512.1 bifunctional metallophosphatase/5'-nucleotidase [Nocardia terpenica]MBF6154831.1 bifunctional metallophosphatase/5'-nucleotidase [Nocardia terpenica]